MRRAALVVLPAIVLLLVLRNRLRSEIGPYPLAPHAPWCRATATHPEECDCEECWAA